MTLSKIVRSLTLARLVIVITFVAVFLLALRPPLDTDMFWHLRAGEWQFEHRAMLKVDLFSNTMVGKDWINHGWPMQVVIYGAYAALGDTGLVLYTAILATAGMAFVYLVCAGDPLIRAFSLVLASMAATIFWFTRPQMISFTLSGLMVYLLWLYQRRNIDRLWFVPPLMILWVNLHGAGVSGFILLVLATAGEGMHWLFDEAIPAWRHGDELSAFPRPHKVIRLIVIGLISAVAISLNPYGPRMLLYPFETIGMEVAKGFIVEWASPDFHLSQTWPFLWLLLGTLLVVGVSPERLDWRDAVYVVGTAYSAMVGARLIPTFAIVTAPIFALHLDSWLKERGYHLNWERAPRRGVQVALNWTLLIMILLAGVFQVVNVLDPGKIEEARRETLPVDAVEYIENEKPPGPLFNSYNWGGYLTWAARDYPVYVDGRADFYGDDFLLAYLATYYAQPGWEGHLDKAGVNTILIESGSPLAQVVSITEGWSRLYEDGVASVFVRDEPIPESE